MASSKEIQQTSRPLTHRPSISSSLSGSTMSITRQSHSRNTSHSVIGAALNGSHRVTRRKSMTNTGANVAAISAALQQEAGDRPTPLPIAVSSRRNTVSRNSMSRSGLAGSLPSPPGSLPINKFVSMNMATNTQDSAIDDELNDMSGDEGGDKARVRRASDGQPLLKEGRKSNRPELRCEQCGKGYKHSSCLTKHLWEHTPQWSYTSKLLISKHQQVQLLEAASVLMAINNDPSTTPPDSARGFQSDQDSASPGASGFSEHQEASSADTTPPPQLDGVGAGNPFASFAKRRGSNSGFARSYQSAPYASSAAGSIPNSSGFASHFRHLSQDQRPVSSGRNATGKDDHELAAALYGCSFGSNGGTRNIHQLPADAPPVPPLPAQYLDQSLSGTSFFSSFPGGAPQSYTRGAPESYTRGAPESYTRGAPESYTRTRAEVHKDDVKMDESGGSVLDDDDDDDTRSRARSDDDDDGVFGRMEE